MLSQFRVSNYALLDEISIDFEPGLNILTGETGAGKSILMGALGLILGGRSTADMIRTGSNSATVEGMFEWTECPPSDIIPTDLDVDVEDGSLIVRRDISRDGRNRCFVNGHMVTVAILKRIGDVLVDLHGQHEHQSLLDQRKHISFLDGFGDVKRQRDRVADAYEKFVGQEVELKKLDDEIRTAIERRELYQYQLEELQEADIQDGEDEALERELSVLENAEQLIQATSSIYQTLSQEDDAIMDRISHVVRTLENLEQIDLKLKGAVEGSRSARYHLEDVSSFLQHYSDQIEFDPQRLAEVQDRLDLLKELKRKFGATLDEVCACRDRIAGELERFDSAAERRDEVSAALGKARDTLTEQAQRLSTARKKVAKHLEGRVVQELAELGMEKTRFQVQIEQEETPSGAVLIDGKPCRADASGMDRVEFLLSPNPGEDLKPLVHIASGGEISRILLALKVILAELDKVSTLVFDEVDIGIGGRIAESIGYKLKLLSGSQQVMCITHLHQVACWGDTHFTVRKQASQGRTTTQINPLDEDGRVQEIARMLAGETVDDMAMTHARKMLKRAAHRERETAVARK